MSNQATAHSVTFKRPDGAEVNGYLASPAVLEGAPAIVLIQEWWGLNEQIKGVAIRLAECGYRVLVPDLYRGASTVEEEEAHHLMDSLDFGDAVSQDIKGAVRYLQADSQKVGVTGYCMGGALTLLALNAIPELAAGVVWYGFPPLEYLDAAKIKAPLIGHWGTQDAFFQHRNRRGAGVNAARGRCGRDLLPLPGAPCLCQRNSDRQRPYPRHTIRRRMVATGVGPHVDLLR